MSVEQAAPTGPAGCGSTARGFAKMKRPEHRRALEEFLLGDLSRATTGLDLADAGSLLVARARRMFTPNSSNTRSSAPRGRSATAQSRSGWATARCIARWPPDEWPTAHARRARSGRGRDARRPCATRSCTAGRPRGRRSALRVADRLEEAVELLRAALGVVRPGRAAVQQQRRRAVASRGGRRACRPPPGPRMAPHSHRRLYSPRAIRGQTPFGAVPERRATHDCAPKGV